MWSRFVCAVYIPNRAHAGLLRGYFFSRKPTVKLPQLVDGGDSFGNTNSLPLHRTKEKNRAQFRTKCTFGSEKACVLGCLDVMTLIASRLSQGRFRRLDTPIKL